MVTSLFIEPSFLVSSSGTTSHRKEEEAVKKTHIFKKRDIKKKKNVTFASLTISMDACTRQHHYVFVLNFNTCVHVAVSSPIARFKFIQ